MLTAEHINCSYGKKQVLFDVSINVGKGDIALLVGSNGSGKSTFFKCLYRLLPFQRIAGATIRFNGQDLGWAKTHSLLESGLAYVPQSGFFYEHLTVKENLEIPLLNDSKADRNEKMDQLLGLFPALGTLLQKRPGQISGGERQLMNLAGILQRRPLMVLLDEPFSGLSNKNLDLVCGHLTMINQQMGCTILMIEHRISEALPIASRVFGLKLGRMAEIALDEPAEMKKSITMLLI